MSNIENLGIYGEFSRDADAFIKQIQSNAAGDVALKQHVEGAVVGVVIAGAVAAGVVLIKNGVNKYKAGSDERKLSTATATSKLKTLILKRQRPSDEEPVDNTGGEKPDGGDGS